MLTSNILTGPGVSHAFFTREGGVSTGIYTSLNCGAGSDDNPDAVVENKRRAATRMSVADDRLWTLYQIHSANVITVDGGVPSGGSRPEADGIATREPGIALGILTADCAPVLFSDPENGGIGAAHAGWKGALSGLIENTVAAMENLGADRTRIRAAIGPCIAQASYQVGEEFPAPFLAANPSTSAFFAPDYDPGKQLFDLRGYVASRLEQAGIVDTEALSNDTYAEEEAFFSYRRTCHRGEGDYGRGLSAIALADTD